MGSRSGKFRENPEMREPSAIGKAIYYFRTDRQLTQDDVANDGGISKQRISEIETGAVQDPHPDTLNKIAIGLSITVDELLKKADEYAKESGNRGAKTRAEYDAWERSNQSLFRPLERGSGDRKIIERFLDHAENDQIVRNEAVEAQSNAILDTSRFVMLAGRAGTGKTMTALDLARRRETGKNRVFVATGWQTEGEDGFVEGAIQRSHRSSTIIIDDAHHDFVKADRVLNRTLYATHGRPITFILTARVNTKHELTDDLAAEGLLTHTALNGQYIWLEPSDAFFRAIIEKARPDLRLITNAQLKRLVTMSACDMMLFRQILDSTQALDDLNELSLHDVTRQFLRRYFDTEKVYAPNLLRLAMLGQFEVPVRIERFSLRPLEPMYPRALSALTIETGRPLTYQFIHSSLAELAFSALLWAHGFDEPSQTAVPEIVAFLDESQPDDRRLGVIEQILKGRLQLIDGSLLKLSLLSDQKLIMWITSNDGNNLGVLSLATELTKGTACNSLYRDALVSRLKSIWRNKYILGSQKFIRGI